MDGLDKELAIREVLGFRAAWLVDLPVPFELGIAISESPERVRVVFGMKESGAFDADEWLLIVGAVAADTTSRMRLITWAESKRKARGWRLRANETYAKPAGHDCELTVERVVSRHEAELVSVVLRA